MLKLPQAKWRYVAAFCLVMGPIKELFGWSVEFLWNGKPTGPPLAGEIVLSTVFAVPLALFFWRIGGLQRFEAEALIDHHIATRDLPVRVTARAGFRLLPHGLPSGFPSDDRVSA